MNPFLDKEQIQNNDFLQELIKENPMTLVRTQMEKPKPVPLRGAKRPGTDGKSKFGGPTGTKSGASTRAGTTSNYVGNPGDYEMSEVTMNATEMEFNRQLEEEIANTEDQATFD